MSNAFDRALVLVGQNRLDLAEGELRRALAEDPENGLAHSLLALCLGSRGQGDEALRESDEGVRLEPDRSFSHYARGRVLCDLSRLKEAEESARAANELDPDDANVLGLIATIELRRRRWSEALDAAGRGLALDPEHATCRNLRAMALVQLGRRDEAAHTLGSALADDPENAFTHANQGWALLHQGDHARALEHFREALRLDPGLEWARIGIVEALKARYLIYRLMLRFFLWMGRQGAVAQWGVLLGFIFGRKLLADLARAHPGLSPYIQPILILTFAFMLLTWISSPLFNLLLRLNRFGRLALSRDQRHESSWIGGCFLLAAACFVANLIHPSAANMFGMIYFGLLLMPLAVTFHQERGPSRLRLGLYTGTLALLGLPILSLIVLGPADPFGGLAGSYNLLSLFLLGAVFSTWIPSLLGLRATAR